MMIKVTLELGDKELAKMLSPRTQINCKGPKNHIDQVAIVQMVSGPTEIRNDKEKESYVICPRLKPYAISSNWENRCYDGDINLWNEKKAQDLLENSLSCPYDFPKKGN